MTEATSSTCSQTFEFEDSDTQTRHHLETCPSCREQASLHQVLGSLAEVVPRPSLSPGFHTTLRQRLAEERIHQQQAQEDRRWRRKAMRIWTILGGYALLAACLSALILTGLPTLRAGQGPFLAAAFILLTPFVWLATAAPRRHL